MNAAEDKEEPPRSDEKGDIARGDERRLTIMGNRLDSRDLFVGTQEIVIVHGREAYHLRLTAQNKLILTK
jgi:hemin uptake protein HemP